MSDSAENSPPASAAPPMKKKGIKPLWIAIIAIVIVVGLVAVVYYGGFLNNNENDDALQSIKDKGVLVVGVDVPYAPFEYLNSSSGKYEGVDMEIVQHIADELGVDLEIKPLGFSELIAAVQSGRIDIAISSMTITADREKSIDFSIPYYDANQCCMVHTGSSILSIADLNGKVVAAQLGTTGAMWVQDNLVDTGNISSGDFKTYDYVDTVALAVQNGQVDAAIIDTPVAKGFASSGSFNLNVSFTIITNEQYGIAMPEHQDQLKAAINGVITEMKNDGSLQTIYDKYNV